MLESLIPSKTRIKLLIKSFINGKTTTYLCNLANEFGESTNGIKFELTRFEDKNLLEAILVQNKKIYRANENHPYFKEMHRMLFKICEN